jgi:hypothetical protein
MMSWVGMGQSLSKNSSKGIKIELKIKKSLPIFILRQFVKVCLKCLLFLLKIMHFTTPDQLTEDKMTLTIELPASLTHQFRERQIPEKEIQGVVLAALEIWLTQKDATNATTGGRFVESAVPFVRRLIAQNRTLFETLAQR